MNQNFRIHQIIEFNRSGDRSDSNGSLSTYREIYCYIGAWRALALQPAHIERKGFFLFLMAIHKLDRIKVTDFVSHFSRFFFHKNLLSFLFFFSLLHTTKCYFSGKCQNFTANWSDEILCAYQWRHCVSVYARLYPSPSFFASISLSLAFTCTHIRTHTPCMCE